MKRRGNTAILETLDEVDEVFWGPTSWDSRQGGSKCGQYAAYHCLKLPESEAKKFGVECATDELAEYWNALSIVETGYAPFDFFLGREYTKYEKKVRSTDNTYLIAAKHIATVGVDDFDIEISNGSNYRGVKFTNKQTKKSFTFKDTVDHDLTTDALNLYYSIQSVEYKKSLEEDLNNFIN
jgi:hypothetical protein